MPHKRFVSLLRSSLAVEYAQAGVVKSVSVGLKIAHLSYELGKDILNQMSGCIIKHRN